ncbi:MAG: NYN domain-containing protein [Nanoarchaeota archaeon]|nr:NYN domain-containing protein [Nanoarchaeota archaeon]
MTIKHKNQRVGVFVDVQNLYYSAKKLYNAKVNFKEILKESVALRKLIRAFAYVIKADVKDEGNFFDVLEKMGYDIRAKDLQVFYGGHKKGDWDVGIAMDIVKLAPKLDVIVIVSGDGDYVPLVEHAQSVGCRVEGMAFGKSSSTKLKEACDEFIDLDKNTKRFLIKSR